MNTDIPKSKTSQIMIIWSITSVATCSVLSGVGYGIRRISEICFCIGLSLMFSVLILGKMPEKLIIHHHHSLHRQHCFSVESLCSIHRILSAVDDTDWFTF